ncbi:hypothetical protein B296_00036474 [Ensete ventricosum]|uniref:Uncharacterized protein n=1 Tax=Ensete ventricosum TaxID=4639 RepID=A0A426ZGI4_ENSVE|nr:hypothetical protein B296_00036474 [Ensete ventricosum]
MAFYFVLSIPFLERDSGGGGASSENKARDDARLEAVVRAMELGYAGVCPFREAASVAFNRDLLGGASLASPFHQFTRLTILAVALNRSALLRTHDLDVLRPLSQDAFDKACESSEVRSGYGFLETIRF